MWAGNVAHCLQGKSLSDVTVVVRLDPGTTSKFVISAMCILPLCPCPAVVIRMPVRHSWIASRAFTNIITSTQSGPLLVSFPIVVLSFRRLERPRWPLHKRVPQLGLG